MILLEEQALLTLVAIPLGFAFVIIAIAATISGLLVRRQFDPIFVHEMSA